MTISIITITKQFLRVVVLILSIGYSAIAQQLGVNTSIFKAQGAFNDNLNKMPVGASVNFLLPVGESQRFNLGTEIGVAMYSNLTYNTVDNYGNDIYIDEEDCFWNAAAIVQFNVFQTPIIKVYTEGRLGISTFFSSKTIDDGRSAEDEFEFHGTSFNSGIGGGIKLNAIGLFGADALRYKWLWLDFAATINSGSKSHYRNAEETSLSLEDADYVSLTNNINYRIGVSFNFNKYKYK